MNPWFPEHWAFLPGTVFGTTVGVFGGVAGTLAAQGRGFAAVRFGWWAFLALAVGLLAAGLAALTLGQPYGVWYGLLLPGAIGLFVLPACGPGLRQAYRQAEQRRLTAQDL